MPLPQAVLQPQPERVNPFADLTIELVRSKGEVQA